MSLTYSANLKVSNMFLPWKVKELNFFDRLGITFSTDIWEKSEYKYSFKDQIELTGEVTKLSNAGSNSESLILSSISYLNPLDFESFIQELNRAVGDSATSLIGPRRIEAGHSCMSR